MVIAHKAHSGRTKTGGRVLVAREKKLFEAGKDPTRTRVGKRKLLSERTKGGGSKYRLAQSDVVNVFDPKKKAYTKATIKLVTENTSNRNYVRRNIMTKGAVIDTSAGKARITNRPGQEGQINAVLI